MTSDQYSFPHYLTAKRSVDDRALNRYVWERLAADVAARRTHMERPFAVLELGAGVGTMVERAVEWQLFAPGQGPVAYTAIDALPDNIGSAHQRLRNLPPWLSLRMETADALEFCERAEEHRQYDLLIAHAFLDLLNLPTALPRLRQLLRPGGLFYFTINFDGATILEPAIDAEIDAGIEQAYHRTMDERITDGQPSGDSRTGRHLFSRLAAAGYHVQAAGSSDWVVHPVNGVYPGDEAFFLHFIIHTMHGALDGDPAVARLMDAAAFNRWIAVRHTQIDRGELTYIAHQLDFLGWI
jgi:SAM-dependent methyltransferase